MKYMIYIMLLGIIALPCVAQQVEANIATRLQLEAEMRTQIKRYTLQVNNQRKLVHAIKVRYRNLENDAFARTKRRGLLRSLSSKEKYLASMEDRLLHMVQTYQAHVQVTESLIEAKKKQIGQG